MEEIDGLLIQQDDSYIRLHITGSSLQQKPKTCSIRVADLCDQYNRPGLLIDVSNDGFRAHTLFQWHLNEFLSASGARRPRIALIHSDTESPEPVDGWPASHDPGNKTRLFASLDEADRWLRFAREEEL
jgi:hypothetical protein